jgi:aspartate kinase
MEVMKFGGASVKDAPSVKNVCAIIRQVAAPRTVVVVSAMDKTTNQLEILAWLARDGKEEETWAQLSRIRKFHGAIMDELFGPGNLAVYRQVTQYFLEIEKICQGILLLGEFPPRTYDRIVSYGEMIATAIVAHHLIAEGVKARWLDVRNLIKTDATHQQANVVWTLTRENIRAAVMPLWEEVQVVITQGFIATSMEGKVTTLGREGSDYTAAIFAHCLEAERVTVWKDVKGILNADPRLSKDTVKIDSIRYDEAVEMTFYGATVIHPKTIKPLFNLGIPLHVKSFLDVREPGSVISNLQKSHASSVTSRIVKKAQAMVRITPRDFSFMDEQLLSRIFGGIARVGLQVNLVQTTAISLTLVVNQQAEMLRELVSQLLDEFTVEIQENLELVTLVNFTPAHLAEAQGALLMQQVENKLFVVKQGGAGPTSV